MLNFLLFFLYNSLVTRRCYINDETPSRILFKNQNVRTAMFNVMICLYIKIPQNPHAFILNDALWLVIVPFYSLSQVISLTKFEVDDFCNIVVSVLVISLRQFLHSAIR